MSDPHLFVPEIGEQVHIPLFQPTEVQVEAFLAGNYRVLPYEMHDIVQQSCVVWPNWEEAPDGTGGAFSVLNTAGEVLAYMATDEEGAAVTPVSTDSHFITHGSTLLFLVGDVMDADITEMPLLWAFSNRSLEYIDASAWVTTFAPYYP